MTGINSLKMAITHDFRDGDAKMTVVMLHGVASSSVTYGKAVEYLESDASLKGVRFVTLDLLGAGDSPKDDALFEYDYKDQITALRNTIQELAINGPLILVGHSMGTMIAVRYATEYPEEIFRLVLLSPPVYTESDIDNPAFKAGIKLFRDAVSVKNREILREKAFNNEMNKIVMNRKNYKRLTSVKVSTTLVYGKKDEFIAAHNIPKAVAANPKYLTAISTDGRHGITADKYTVLANVLKEAKDEII